MKHGMYQSSTLFSRQACSDVPCHKVNASEIRQLYSDIEHPISDWPGSVVR